jgi:protein involved in polysaccharide export with SLBB domain
VLAWAGGVIVLGLYQLGGWVVVRRMRRTGEPIEDACAMATFQQLIDRLTISRSVRLARSTLVQVPTVIGWLRPVVLLPVNALTGLTSDQLAGLLAHELAHVRRHDYLVNILQTIVETLLFYHPAIWWMSRVIRQERENACDDLAAGVCDRATYAQALAAMESLRQSPALALSARGGALLPRIRRILGLPDAHRRRALASGLAAGSIVVAIVVSLFVLQACSSATEPASKDHAPTTQKAVHVIPSNSEERTAIGTADQKELELLKLEAESTTRIDAARAHLDILKLEYDRKAKNPNAYSASEIDEAKVHLIEGEILVKAAEEDQSRAKLKYEQQQARLTTAAIDPRDLKAEKGDYTLGPSDLVSVSIYDLTAVGAETKREERITDSGAISMPLIGNVKIAGKTVADAEKAISKAYEDAAYLKSANVMLTLLDARSRSFSILFTRASAGVAGQYNIPTNDFRLLDALATSKAELAQIDNVKLRRDGEDGHTRLLEMRGGVLLTGDPQANVIIRPKDTIIVQTREGAQPMTSTNDIQKLQEQVDATSLALEQLKQSYGPQNPRVVAAQQQLAVLNRALAQRQDAIAAAQNTPAGAPADNTAAHFVRLVIGTDRMTFEGKPVTWDNIRDELKNVPDRANTALQLAIGSEDVTIGQENKARGIAMGLVSEFGFKYLTLIGLHAVGTKAGDEAPATQPAK